MAKSRLSHLRCPCGTGNTYTSCCKPLICGAQAPSAERLIRSRYTAYARSQADYIIKTTCPGSPAYHPDRRLWLSEIKAFCEQTRFRGLTLMRHEESSEQAIVEFRAMLVQDGVRHEMREISLFVCQAGLWLYAEALGPQKPQAPV